jgi:hypothetical protein
MANSNFVVHNGLTVGPLTIDAATGDINTSGNVNISGNIGVSAIQKNDTSITITDTGTNSTIVYNIDGSLRANMNSSGMNITGELNTTGNIITDGLNAGSINTTGNIITDGLNAGSINTTGNIITAKLDAGSINTTGNILGAVGTFSSINIAGEAAASLADATALAIALGG